ncbi:MAG: zinc ribbon domain-containing protein, partial [Promethearchaeota archaeon]
MSRVVRFCRKCGSSIVPGARFCNRCGTPVDPQSTFAAHKNAISESGSQIEESIEEKEIPSEEFKQIITTYNVWKIEEKLRPLNMKLEELSAKKEIGELSDEEYNSESAGLKEEKELLEKELTEKMDVKPLSIYFLIFQEQEAAERLSKLESIFRDNKTSQTTYSRLKREYSEKLQAVRNEITSERQKLSRWKKILEKGLSDIKMSLEESSVRYELGEVS